MRAVVQRVSRASVTVDGQLISQIGDGFLVLIGVAADDSAADSDYLADKIVNLRVFKDGAGLMNRSLGDAGGAILAVSQFTLLADCRKGRRPSFSHAAAPAVAEPLFDHFVSACRSRGVHVETGRFRTDMAVELTNDGPVTVLVDSKRAF
jgi:D-tyrosyl-tRNA(Tyr) deacylase